MRLGEARGRQRRHRL